MELAELKERLSQAQPMVLEAFAAENGVTLFQILQALECKMISGSHFDRIWHEISAWETMTLIVHTADGIWEFSGKLPGGTYRHSYFNLRATSGLSGHIKAEHCTQIAFLKREFMGKQTASVIFLNRDGGAICKIFVGRDSHRELLTDQLQQFEQMQLY